MPTASLRKEYPAEEGLRLPFCRVRPAFLISQKGISSRRRIKTGVSSKSKFKSITPSERNIQQKKD